MEIIFHYSIMPFFIVLGTFEGIRTDVKRKIQLFI